VPPHEYETSRATLLTGVGRSHHTHRADAWLCSKGAAPTTELRRPHAHTRARRPDESHYVCVRKLGPLAMKSSIIERRVRFGHSWSTERGWFVDGSVCLFCLHPAAGENSVGTGGRFCTKVSGYAVLAYTSCMIPLFGSWSALIQPCPPHKS